MAKVACIGTREVSENYQSLLTRVGSWLARQDHTISTGNANGADNLFARGANSIDPTLVQLHLPWNNYNRELIVPGNRVTIDGNCSFYHSIASGQHPRWRFLSRGAKALHARNVAIIQGTSLVIALPNWDKLGGGGTGMGLRIAEYYKTPIWDLTKDKYFTYINDMLNKNAKLDFKEAAF